AVAPGYAALGIVVASRRNEVATAEVARIHYELAEQLGLDRLQRYIATLPRNDRWQTMARAALRDDLHGVHFELTERVLAGTPEGLSAADRVRHWIDSESDTLERIQGTLEDIWRDETADLARMSVGLRVVRSLLV